MLHQEKLAALIYSRYSQRHSLEHLRFEARQMAPLLQVALVEIGYMKSDRRRHIVEVYAGLGMMKADFSIEGFLYDPNPPPPAPAVSWSSRQRIGIEPNQDIPFKRQGYSRHSETVFIS